MSNHTKSFRSRIKLAVESVRGFLAAKRKKSKITFAKEDVIEVQCKMIIFLWAFDPSGDRGIGEEVRLLQQRRLNKQGLEWLPCIGDDATAEGTRNLLLHRVLAKHINVFHVAGVGDDRKIGIRVPCSPDGGLSAEQFIFQLATWNESDRLIGAIINACNSQYLAKEAANRWGLGIGTTGEILPETALYFSTTLYDVMAFQRSIDMRRAFVRVFNLLTAHDDPMIANEATLYRIFPEEETDAD